MIINALHPNLAARLRLAAGDETPNLLLVSDGAYLARPGGLETLAAGGLGQVFVDAQALASRGLSAAAGIESVDDDRMASLIVEEAARVIRI
ncbi:MAG: hypothetical protein V1797_08555 [Pseudomonadota bacterium]